MVNCSYRFFSRRGGVSKPPRDFLNVSFGVGDDPAAVEQNRALVKREIGARVLVSSRQVHGSSICVVDQKPESDLELDGYDALITDLGGIGLMIQQADCQGVLLYDCRRQVVAAVHNGWRGSALDIIGRTIARMGDSFGSRPVDIRAWISPSLGPCCGEMVNYEKELPPALHHYQVRPCYFDFWAMSRDQLTATGVFGENIEIAKTCTCCNDEWFSHRRDRQTGRGCSLITLQGRGGLNG